jgi:hypothetical protein
VVVIHNNENGILGGTDTQAVDSFLHLNGVGRKTHALQGSGNFRILGDGLPARSIP